MAVSFKSGYDLSETTRAKSIGSLIIFLYIVVIFILICSIGYFALRTSEDSLQDIYPCSFNNDVAFNFYDSWIKPRYCPPAVNIFFLKTHKCASSTVQNILMRYGDERNLSFLLPKDRNYIGHPEHFSRWLIPEKRKAFSHFNILCHHLRFNADAVREVMPQSTIFISILRNPVSLFRSMYDYYNMTDTFHKTLDDFLRDEILIEKLSSIRVYNRLGRNQMLFDFGYDSTIWDNETLILNAIEEIDENFHFIMIQELFDESLILLKHKLCWSMSDIVYLKHNMRTQNAVPQKDDSLTKKIENLNTADKMLYTYFLKKINNIIDSFGRERMAKEVNDLRLWNNVWFNHCVKQMTQMNKNASSDTKPFNSKVYSFILNDEPIADICKRLAMEELQYTEKLRTKQKLLYKI